MKRTAVFLLSLFILVMVVSSCSSSKNCAAYGETSRYQKSNGR